MDWNKHLNVKSNIRCKSNESFCIVIIDQTPTKLVDFFSNNMAYFNLKDMFTPFN